MPINFSNIFYNSLTFAIETRQHKLFIRLKLPKATYAWFMVKKRCLAIGPVHIGLIYDCLGDF